MLDEFLNRKKENRSRRQEVLSAYLDGELSARQQAKLEKELAQDPALKRELEELRRTSQLLSLLPTLAVPRAFTLDPAVYGRVKPRRFHLYPIMRAATVLAMLIFAFLFAGDLFFKAGMGMPAMAPVAEEMAVEITRVVEKEAEVTVEFAKETVADEMMEEPAAVTLVEPIVEEAEEREVEAPAEAVEEMAVEEEAIAESELGLPPTTEMPTAEPAETDATEPPVAEPAEGGVSAGGELPTATATPGPAPTISMTEAASKVVVSPTFPTHEPLPMTAPTETIPTLSVGEAANTVPAEGLAPAPEEATLEEEWDRAEEDSILDGIDWGLISKLGMGILAAGLLIVTLIARRFNW